jgi:hypothetical protein
VIDRITTTRLGLAQDTVGNLSRQNGTPRRRSGDVVGITCIATAALAAL